MATTVGTGSGTLASLIPDLADAANIQTALKQLYYGTTGGTLSQTTGIYGALYTLYSGNPTLAGNVTISGTLTVNGTTTTINTNTLVVDDKNIELGSISSGVVSTTGTIGTVSGSGPYTATITNMTNTSLIPGQTITATAGTGSLGSGVVTVVTIASASSITVSSTLTMTAGTITNITGGAATDNTANGGGITLKGATDKTITWDSTNSNWTTSENWNLDTGKTLKITNSNVISGTAAALVVGGNASTTIAIGANGGTATILNPTVTLTNATSLNLNGATTVTVAGSTATTANIFNTTQTAVNFAGAAATLTMGATTGTGSVRNATVTFPNATTISGVAGTLALFNTGTTTVNAFGAATTIGLGNASGTTTLAGNLTLATASTTLTLPATGAASGPIKFTSGSLPTTSTSSAGSIEYDGIAFYATPKVNNTTAGRGIILSPSTFVLFGNYNPTVLSLGVGGGSSTTEYSALNNKYLYLAASTQYFVEAYIKIYHSLVTGASGVPTATLTFFLKAPSLSSFYIDTISNIDMSSGNWTTSQTSSTSTQATTTQYIEGLGAEIIIKSITNTPNSSDTGYSIIRLSGILITGSTAGNFAPSIRQYAVAASSGTTSVTTQIGSTSWCKITPISATPSADTNIGGWA